MAGPPYDHADDVPKGTPTPTQDEHNKIKAGEEVTLADDGSGPDPGVQATARTQPVQRRQAAPTHTTAARPMPPRPAM